MVTLRYAMVGTYTCVQCRIHERKQCFCHDGYSSEQHTPQGQHKQQQHNNTANLVLQLINEKISGTIRIKGNS